MKHSTGRPTRYEQERIEAMVKLGCAACAHLGIPYAQIEVHHILDGGVRMGHWFTIPLCAGHHQGYFTKLQTELIEPQKLVSISSGRKAFRRVYPTERELWVRVQNKLKLPAVWPTSKVLARRVHVGANTNLVELSPRPAIPALQHAEDARDDHAAGEAQ
jgi:hypothetical protein